MAKQKFDGLILGKGAINANTTSAQVFSSTIVMGTYSAAISYSIDNMVEFSGKLWRSLANANSANTPSTASAFWELYSNTVKDGDIAVIDSGIQSDINIRQNAVWVSMLNVPINISLPNNVTGQLAFRLPLLVARAATISYSITNGSAYRTGTLRYTSDGTIGPTGVSIADQGVVDQGGDVGFTFDADVDGTGTYVEITYDSSSLLGSPATMSYRIQGWQ